MKPNHHGSSRQILAELESLLTQPAEPTRSEVEAAHGQATSAIRSVNERLASAHQLILAGRRAEAIEIAEGPPHVLDEIAVLDSQLIRDWEHWSGQFGLPRFAPLRSDLASLLNGAYTAEHQLEHLLRRHRLLAMGRANLRQRIAVLSQLAAADPSNPQWNKALIECQRRRLDQLAERTAQARKLKDLRCLQQVMAELRQTRWLTPVSKAQVDAVQKQIDLVQRRESTTEAIALAEHLQDAFAAGDKTRLKPLIGRWRQIAIQADTAALSEILPQVRSVIHWFDQDARQQREAEAQSKALDRVQTISSDAQADEIRSVIDSIASTGAETPPELRAAYFERVRQETRAKRIKAGLITGAIASLLIAVTSMAALAYRAHKHEAALTAMLDTIDLKLAAGDLATADRLLSVAPHDDQRFDVHRMRLTDQKLVEDRRKVEFSENANTLRKALDEAKQVDEFDNLTIRVAQLVDRAKLEDEYATARELTQYAKTRREDRKQVFIDEAKQLISQIREELKTLAPDSQARTTLTTWNRQLLNSRTNRWLRAESALLSELQTTSDAVADRRDEIRQMADAEKSLVEISASVGDWDRWESLAEDADEMEASVRGKFLAIARCTQEERDLWSAIEQWNQIASAWTLEEILSATPDQAGQIKSDLSKVQRSRLGDLPAADDFIAASQVATPTTARGQRDLELILAHLQSTKMSRIGAIKIAATATSPDRWHYFPPSGDSLLERGESLRIKHFTDLETSKTTDSMVLFSAIEVPADFSQFHGDYIDGKRIPLAPHVSFCNNARKQLERVEADPTEWDQVFVNLYRELVELDTIDPLVQYFLVSAILDIGSNGSWLLASAYAEHRSMIEDANVDINVNWIDPKNEQAARAREDAAGVLAKLRKLTPTNPTEQVEKMKQTLVIDTKYVPVGWLDENGGRWQVHTTPLSASGPLFVRYGDSGSNRTTQIGEIADGKVSLRSTSGAAFRVGRPVWVGMPVAVPLERSSR